MFVRISGAGFVSQKTKHTKILEPSGSYREEECSSIRKLRDTLKGLVIDPKLQKPSGGAVKSDGKHYINFK